MSGSPNIMLIEVICMNCGISTHFKSHRPEYERLDRTLPQDRCCIGCGHTDSYTWREREMIDALQDTDKKIVLEKIHGGRSALIDLDVLYYFFRNHNDRTILSRIKKELDD